MAWFRKSKEHPKRPTLYSFAVVKVFPPSDRLGIDILRLMAVHNDITRVRSWMEASRHVPAGQPAQNIHGNLIGMQLRLVLSFVWERVGIVENIKKRREFHRLEKLLDEQAEKALQELEDSKSRLNKFAYSFLELVRNKITFHYDPNKFVAGLKFGKSRLGNKWKSTYVIKGRPPLGEAYFELADTLRVVTFLNSLKPIDDLTFANIIGPIERGISRFLIGLFEAYLIDREVLGEVDPRLDKTDEQLRVVFGLHP